MSENTMRIFSFRERMIPEALRNKLCPRENTLIETGICTWAATFRKKQELTGTDALCETTALTLADASFPAHKAYSRTEMPEMRRQYTSIELIFRVPEVRTCHNIPSDK